MLFVSDLFWPEIYIIFCIEGQIALIFFILKAKTFPYVVKFSITKVRTISSPPLLLHLVASH